GAFGTRPSFESFITYTFLPEMIQKTGKTCIDHLIVRTINKRTFEAIAFLSTKIVIKNVYIPWWTGRVSSGAWFCYVKLKKAVSLSNGKIVSLSKKHQIVDLHHSSLFIQPSITKQKKYESVTYPHLQVTGTMHNETIDI